MKDIRGLYLMVQYVNEVRSDFDSHVNDGKKVVRQPLITATGLQQPSHSIVER